MRWRRRPVLLREHGSLQPPVDGAELVDVTVTVDHRLVALWATPAATAAVRARGRTEAGVGFAFSRTAELAPAVVTVGEPEQRVLAELVHLPVAHPYVELLPDEQVLLVGSRAAWTPEDGAEHNALVYDAEGRLVRAGTVGDGVGVVQVSATGDVWVGYFDEGVYGNFGWGSPGGPQPLGAAGVVRFSADLQPAWELPSGGSVPPVDDCYALNVGRTTVWACYDSDFPVVRITGETATAFANDVTPVSALVGADDRVALFGGRGDDADRLVVGRVAQGAFTATRTTELTMPDRGPLPPGTRVFGRDEHLHAVVGDRWLRADPLG